MDIEAVARTLHQHCPQSYHLAVASFLDREGWIGILIEEKPKGTRG